MKKLIVILLAFVLILSLSACAQTPGAAPSDATAAETLQSGAVSKPESDSPLAGKRIGCTIVYIANTVVPFDFVVSVVDNGAWGAVSTLRALGNEDVKVLSMGAYGAEPFEALYENDPNYLACVVVDPQVISDGIYSAAERHLKGESVDATTYIDLFVADHSNVTNFWSFDE